MINKAVDIYLYIFILRWGQNGYTHQKCIDMGNSDCAALFNYPENNCWYLPFFFYSCSNIIVF